MSCKELDPNEFAANLSKTDLLKTRSVLRQFKIYELSNVMPEPGLSSICKTAFTVLFFHWMKDGLFMIQLIDSVWSTF